ncbi:ParB/RepB/Spo0J family partition protein [Sinanaerobacter chloroacetimidivorans]|uniref:ParB/RepB/Spo0J family partition protein n=1 Tax=Sinanaerobacter chloroacetimidivorans TaxID=2818044 RepID=A0A8J8B271_9FIRM|nr:ParB/RepB/Spo0J family partition protein [Sinanaerobacter chloroacetimidivorans]MBR0598432.1 ParB/RepB/Spo0J family partition protein [Sinanaerobacter chloroacetimidivorans]
MAAAKGRGLGKGLEALFSDVEISAQDLDDAAANSSISDGGILFLDINNIKPNSKQPRKHFDDEKIEELARSIESHGIIQPIMVRSAREGYEIVAGERRWRAARKASLKKVPCIIRELDEEQNMLVAIIENMQREDLNPMEEAEALHQMITTFGLTQEEVSKSVGKSRPYITNALRLLKLAPVVQSLVTGGELSNGHARALAGIKDEKRQMELANHIVKLGLSVRETEALVGETTDGQSRKKQKAKPRDKNAEIQHLEDELKEALGTKVAIQIGVKRGKIEIEYYNREELERILELLLSLK